MRAAGAFGLQNNVWVLPFTPENEQFIETQMAYIKEQGAASYTFEVTSLNSAIEETILAGFRSQSNEEYSEFCERCDALLAELERETTDEKFTFAELEETETDLHKLETWLAKIIGRDFVKGSLKERASEKLEQCQQAHKAFASNVYAQHGINPPDVTEE
jgi:hypothetical protein